MRTATFLSFPQLHNTMAALAFAWGFQVYGWAHSDAVVITNVSYPLAPFILRHISTLTNWAAVLTSYDRLAFYNTSTVLKHPWDEHILQNYPADCDSHSTWRLNGFSVNRLNNFTEFFSVLHLAEFPKQR